MGKFVDCYSNPALLAGYLGFSNTTELREWISGPKFWPLYLKYADIRESGTAEAQAVKNVKIRTVYSIIDSQKDWDNLDPDLGPSSHLVSLITCVILANTGVSPPVLEHPTDVSREPYHRIWQAIQWSNRIRVRPEKSPKNELAIVPPHLADKTTIAPRSKRPDSGTAPDLGFEIFWANQDEFPIDREEHWPEQIQRLPAPSKYPDSRYFRDEIRALFNFPRLKLDIYRITVTVTPKVRPNPYQTTVELNLGVSWDRIRQYCLTEDSGSILWFLHAKLADPLSASFETDVPMGLLKWLSDQERTIVANQTCGGPSASNRAGTRTDNSDGDTKMASPHGSDGGDGGDDSNNGNLEQVNLDLEKHLILDNDHTSTRTDNSDSHKTMSSPRGGDSGDSGDGDDDSDDGNGGDDSDDSDGEDGEDEDSDDGDSEDEDSSNGGGEDGDVDSEAEDREVFAPGADFPELRASQEALLLSMVTAEDMIKVGQVSVLTPDGSHRLAGITALEHANDAARAGDIDPVNEPTYWKIEKLKVKAVDNFDYTESCQALDLDPTEPRLPGMAQTHHLHPWQVTGLVWMLTREIGYIPDRVDMAPFFPDQRMLPTLGGIVSDDTGLGKTFMLCALVLARANSDSPMTKPTLILAPTSVIYNWVKTIQDAFPGLRVLLYHGASKSKGSRYNDIRINKKDFEEYRHDDPYSLKPHLRHLLDSSNPLAGRTIVVSTYKTWQLRTLLYIANTDNPDANPSISGSRLEGLFGRCILDEGHMVKRILTKAHRSIVEAHIQYRWIVTATPLINSFYDLLGLLSLLWRPEWQAELPPQLRERVSQPGYSIFDEWPNNLMDPRARLAANPRAIQSVLGDNWSDVEPLKTAFPKVAALIQLRRSMATIIRNGPGRPMSLADFIPPYKMNSLSVSLRAKEEREYLLFHRSLTRQFMNKALKSNRGEPDPLADRTGNQAFSFPLAEWRRLSLMTSALRLERLHHKLLEGTGRIATLAANIQRWRDTHKDYEYLLRQTTVGEEDVPDSVSECIPQLAYGSPKLRCFGLIVKDVVCVLSRKLLVFVEWPLTLFYVEQFLRAMRFKVETILSQMTLDERMAVSDSFNDPDDKSIEILLCSYRVSSLGINLHLDCSDCVLFEPAMNTNTEIQAYGRLHRLGQQNEQRVYRLSMANSFNEYQDYRMLCKMRAEIAGWMGDREEIVKELLADGDGDPTHQDLSRPSNFARAVDLIHSQLNGNSSLVARNPSIFLDYSTLGLANLGRA
ncbi:MAG: hypothetical protein M1839_003842 [Geoglossum umbratile]|nr:MAG: hypothetical protein M1839_003842 [Geoglossum umbratile]